MTDQEKAKVKRAAEKSASQVESPEPDEQKAAAESKHHDRFKDATDNLKETTEKLWEGTRHAWNTATFKAVQYKQLAQKKIDQSALHKKISAAHHDLGKLIDDLREEGQKNILNLSEVRAILDRLDDYKKTAAELEEEIERIRAAVPVAEAGAEKPE